MGPPRKMLFGARIAGGRGGGQSLIQIGHSVSRGRGCGHANTPFGRCNLFTEMWAAGATAACFPQPAEDTPGDRAQAVPAHAGWPRCSEPKTITVRAGSPSALAAR